MRRTFGMDSCSKRWFPWQCLQDCIGIYFSWCLCPRHGRWIWLHTHLLQQGFDHSQPSRQKDLLCHPSGLANQPRTFSKSLTSRVLQNISISQWLNLKPLQELHTCIQSHCLFGQSIGKTCSCRQHIRKHSLFRRSFLGTPLIPKSRHPLG